MKLVSLLGAACFVTPLMTACNNSSTTTPSGGNSAAAPGYRADALVGAWNCMSKSSGALPELQETLTFGADGWFSSSKYPEGKKYKFRLDGANIVVSFASHDWTAKITKLADGSLEYDSDAAGQTKASCRKN